MKIAIIGSGSWATALAKLLTDNQVELFWWFRNTPAMEQFRQRGHNPSYLSKSYFDLSRIHFSDALPYVVEQADTVLLATPSAYLQQALEQLPSDALEGKQVVSAVKGILPQQTELISDYLNRVFQLPLERFFTVLGPCHAEEVASEKLSYLTFSGLDEQACRRLAALFATPYLNTRINHDVIGVQYAAVMKNIYALGAGIAHGLDYGDNFLSVFIANAASEMETFLKKITTTRSLIQSPNYASSVYLGDLLVTCYSLYSRNRMFGTMIGKGYSVKAAQLELGMVAEGYSASKCIHDLNDRLGAAIPIAMTVYEILWKAVTAQQAFVALEESLY